MKRQTITLALALGVAAALLLSGASIARANAEEGLGPMKSDSGPPVPTQLREMSAEQFGLKPWFPGAPVDDLLRQKARRQVNPYAPHREILDDGWGPLFHRDPSQIPTSPTATGRTCIPGIKGCP